MLAELREIFYIIGNFCTEYYIPILICTNALALLLAIICLFRTSGKRKKRKEDDFLEELKLNLNIEKAEVKIGQVHKGNECTAAKENVQTNEAAQQAQEIEESEQTVQNVTEEKGAAAETVPVVIEKLVPMDSKKQESQASEEYFTSRSGKVYSKEDVLKQIKD